MICGAPFEFLPLCILWKSTEQSFSEGLSILRNFWRKREGKCWRFCFCFGFNTQKVYNNVLLRLLYKEMYSVFLYTGNVLIFSHLETFSFKKKRKKRWGNPSRYFFFTLVLKTFCLTSCSAKLYIDIFIAIPL